MADDTVKVHNQIKVTIGDSELEITRSQAESLRNQLLAEFPIATPVLPPLSPDQSPLFPFYPNPYPWTQPGIIWTTTSVAQTMVNDDVRTAHQ
jgi:hypothetical protein